MDSSNRNMKSNSFKHLSYKERWTIELRRKNEVSVINLARELHRSRTTIYTEIKRGTTQQIIQGKCTDVYLADLGQQVYEEHRSYSKKSFKFL
ncbi:helix-turn-helix domain-containing protein [Anaerosphaera multitolerans]|uniref:helix-turn-helix domain-containing protein n=1 Tax=Anaerosphaera multitolerans TaxID=2487351 RepID=UPI001F0BD5F8|nr:helix-turn-helix domain-containing protein [Anaerosphaera multitolerans]